MKRPRKSTPEEESEHECKQSIGRKFVAAYRFWKLCGKRQCRRVHGCACDARACHLRLWDLLPQHHKDRIRLELQARLAGHTPQEAARIAEARMQRAPASAEPPHA